LNYTRKMQRQQDVKNTSEGSEIKGG